MQTDGKLLSYSDSTITLDWQGKNATTNASEELQSTLGEGLPFVYFTLPAATNAAQTAVQFVTSPKDNYDLVKDQPVAVPVDVTAYDTTGAKVQSGTGPFELEVSYAIHDVLDNRTQEASTKDVDQKPTKTLIVQDSTQLAVGMSVEGPDIQPGTMITKIVDATHVDISSVPKTFSAKPLTFNQNQIRSFDNFYGIYLPAGIGWSLEGNQYSKTFTANLTTAQNYFSVATLPGGSQGTFNPAFTMFLPHAYTFVTGSTSSFTYDQSTAAVTTTFQLQTQLMQTVNGTTDTGALQALNATQFNNLAPGELPVLKAFNVNGQYNYASPHGEMLLWDGPVFSTQLQYSGILPSVPALPNGGVPITGLPNTGDANLWNNYLLPVLRSVSSNPQSDGTLSLNLLFPNDNNYLQAQAMYGASQLVPILLEISQSTDPGLTANDKAEAYSYAQQLYSAIKDRMGAWLNGANDADTLQLIYYQPATAQEASVAGQTGWQSLMTILSGFLSSETLNDHQLIAGYFIKTAAFLVQYDQTWGGTTEAINSSNSDMSYLEGKMGDIVNLMVGDVSNYNRSSTTFPFLRNFDVYAGHSWADGAANDNKGTNLESSSEAMNYDSGLILWGQETGNQAMQNLGVYMYTNELEGVQTYWFSMKNQTDPFGHATNVIPTQYLGSATNGTQRTIVTKLNSNGGGYVGFIGFQTSRVAGIQFLPFSGSAYYLGQSASFVATTYKLAQKGSTAAGVIPVGPPTYQSLILPYLALSDPMAALTMYQNQINAIAPVNPLDLIDNNAFNIHWIEVLAAYGQVDPNVHADTVSYTVFQDSTSKVVTYVAYNPSAAPETVHFYDQNNNLLLQVTVPAQTEVVSQGSGTNAKTIASQTTPNFSVATPPTRLFFTSSASNQPTLTYGQTGAGEKVASQQLTVPGPSFQVVKTTQNSTTFTVPNAALLAAGMSVICEENGVIPANTTIAEIDDNKVTVSGSGPMQTGDFHLAFIAPSPVGQAADLTKGDQVIKMTLDGEPHFAQGWTVQAASLNQQYNRPAPRSPTVEQDGRGQ